MGNLIPEGPSNADAVHNWLQAEADTGHISGTRIGSYNFNDKTYKISYLTKQDMEDYKKSHSIVSSSSKRGPVLDTKFNRVIGKVVEIIKNDKEGKFKFNELEALQKKIHNYNSWRIFNRVSRKITKQINDLVKKTPLDNCIRSCVINSNDLSKPAFSILEHLRTLSKSERMDFLNELYDRFETTGQRDVLLPKLLNKISSFASLGYADQGLHPMDKTIKDETEAFRRSKGYENR